MPFALSGLSRKRLQGVHPDLISVVTRAIELTTVDFRVQEGVRSKARQRQLVASGASQTTASRHLTGHAVDLVPMVGAAVRWDWPLFYPIAAAMGRAAVELGVPLRWGGCWCREFVTDPQAAVARYVAAKRAAGKPAFIDGPHFELPTATHPA